MYIYTTNRKYTMQRFRFFLWTLTILSYLLLFSSETFAYNTIEYSRGFKIKQYIDNDTLMLIPPSNDTITLVFPNGTSSELAIDLKGQNAENTLIGIYPLTLNYIWILYARKSAESSSDQNMFGMLMNWHQEILSYDVDLNCPYLINDVPTVATNINLDGFIVISRDVNNQFTWNEFALHQVPEPSEPGSIVQLNSRDTFVYQNQTELVDYSAFGTVDGSYGILFLLRNLNIKSVDPVNGYQAQPIYVAYLAFIRTNTAQPMQRPTLVYETSEVEIASIRIQSCKIGFVDHANVCFLKSIVNRMGVFLSANVGITFLSSGSVIKVEQLGLDNNNPEQATPNSNNITDSVIPLENDGLILIRHDGNSISGRIYDPNENDTGTKWDIPENLTTGDRLLEFGIFRNNTVWIVLDNSGLIPNNNYTFKILSSDIPKFVQDSGYNNLLVNSTEPKINDTLFMPYPDKIRIKYSIPIVPGPENITIYERDRLDIIRQTFPGNSKFCKIDENDTTIISCDVIESTFNRLNTTYMVVVDNNFVKNSFSDEPLLGIPDNVWVFSTNTSSNKEDTETTFTGGLKVLLRLNDEGTNLFPQEKEFLNNLSEELSEIIPVNSNRLSFTGHVGEDTSTRGRLLVELNILDRYDLMEPSSLQIVDNLNTLIMNKDVTMLPYLNHTKYLDETYGAHTAQRLWENVKYLVLGFLFTNVILGSLYIWARYKHPEGHNSAMFKVPLVLFDLVMDILFVIYNGKTIPSLFIPSIVILAISFAFNSFLSIVIITHEISHNSEFQKWFNNHTKLTAFFTVLASADVEGLNILKSKIAGLELFSAPYSQVGLSWVLAGSTLNVFITDLPQLVIQLYYLQNVINYTTIPFFTLVISGLIFFIDSISHVYDYIKSTCGKPRVSNQSTNANERSSSEETGDINHDHNNQVE